jgi:hyperosmotically inducible protein
MNKRLTATCIVAGALLLPIAGYAADLASSEASAKTYVKDSVITTRVKTELAEAKLSSLLHINVDTDDRGMVTLSGTASSQNTADKAASIARGVDGVTSVKNHIQITADK